MKRINNSDINFLLSPKTFNISNFTIKFYTVNAEQFYITKTQDNVRVVEQQTEDGETIVDYYLSLDWSELVTLGEGVLQYILLNNFEDAERPDNYYNQSLERTTQYYIDSNIIVDEDEVESYAEIIAELGDKIDGEIVRSTSADTLQTDALNSEIQIRQDQINDILDIIDGIETDLSNYYTKDETYNKTATDELLSAKLDTTAYTPTDLSNYYTKSETSGATEISNALEAKQDVLTEGRAIDITSNVISLDLPISAGTGTNSIIEGSGTTASGEYSHAEGLKTSASGDWSHTEGYNTKASGNFSHAEGNNTTASGIYGSHAEGDSTTASTRTSHAEGFKTTASGNQSHAEGNNTKANGNVSHAEGQNTVASGQRSHAEGESTSAVTTNSHAEGYSTSASGWASHAEGNCTKATGASSHAEGFYTITNNQSEHASGQYNISNKASNTFGDSGNTLFSVGNGSDSTRHNAFEIRQNADIYIVSGGTDIKLQDHLGGGGSSSYTAGDGINITNDVISVTGKQDTLVSGTNIKSINNQSLLGSGNITIQGGGGSSSGFIQVTNPDTAETKVGLVNSLSQYYDTNIGKGAVIEGDGYEYDGTNYNIVASGNYSHAEGFNTTASGNYSHAEGRYTTASGNSSHAEGNSTTANGMYSHAEGDSTKAIGYYSHAEGQSTTAIGNCSHTEGYSTTASGSYSHAEGQNTTASGYSSHAEGYQTTASGSYSHTEGGYGVQASGMFSHAEGGNGVQAIGEASHAEGKNGTKAIGEASHAEGHTTQASGSCSHTEGYITKASGSYSHAEGSYTTASGKSSHAEGNYTTASGQYSHAEGSYTTASGETSHAEGQSTQANGNDSHAEGGWTTASGNYSHAEGDTTIANNEAEHACGRCNVSSSASTTFGDSGNTLFSVGNGTYQNKHNAFEIRQNGDIYISSGSTDIKLQDHLGGNADLSNYYTKTEVNEIVDDVVAGQIDLTTYAKIDWVQTNYALKTDVPKIWTGTETEYNQITTKDNSTIYLLLEDND